MASHINTSAPLGIGPPPVMPMSSLPTCPLGATVAASGHRSSHGTMPVRNWTHDLHATSHLVAPRFPNHRRLQCSSECTFPWQLAHHGPRAPVACTDWKHTCNCTLGWSCGAPGGTPTLPSNSASRLVPVPTSTSAPTLCASQHNRRLTQKKWTSRALCHPHLGRLF